MSDHLDKSQTVRVDWRERVNGIVVGVRKEAILYCVLGITSVVTSGLGFYFLFGDSPLTGIAFMGFFYIAIVFFSTMKIYPCIRGGFLVSVEQTCETIGDMRAIRNEIERQGSPVRPKPRPVHEEP